MKKTAWIHNSRIIAIFGVVFLHAAAGMVVYDPVGSDRWWTGNLYDSLARWCVPVLVMISGALLLDPGRKETIEEFYFRRLSRIFVPTVFWSVFYLSWTYLNGAARGEPPRMLELARNLASGKSYYHLWFLYMIAFLYVFAPFLRKVVAGSSRFEIFILAVSAFFVSALNELAKLSPAAEPDFFVNWFLYYIPYFLLGHLVGAKAAGQTRFVLWISFVSSVLLTATGCYFVARQNGIHAGLYFYGYLSITVIPMSVSIIYLLRTWADPIGSEQLARKLSSLTLGIYLVHPVFLETLGNAWAGYRALHPALSVPLLSAAVFGLSWAAAWAIGKIPWLRRTI